MDITPQIIELEIRALERWNQGDPSGYLELSDPDVVYFDPFLAHRLDGLTALTELYESLRGKIRVDRYEMIRPVVQYTESMAVLTFNLMSITGNNKTAWHCTEVYRLNNQKEWKLIQTHWSFSKAE